MLYFVCFYGSVEVNGQCDGGRLMVFNSRTFLWIRIINLFKAKEELEKPLNGSWSIEILMKRNLLLILMLNC